MQNEFTYVRSKRNKKKHTKINCTEFTAVERQISLDRKLETILENLKADQFSVNLADDINEVIKKISKSQIDYILCYGLGKFSESFISLHQLAVLLFLQKTHNSVVHIFDPLFDSFEIEYLKKYNFRVIEENEEGKHKIAEDKLTLAFFPHCPKQLVNNFLWANWNKNLKNCLIISNSFSQILQNNVKKVLFHSANYILNLYNFCEEIPLKDTYEFPNVFNDLSIHFFQKLAINSNLFQSLAEEPKYSVDLEFVTREIKNL